MSNSIEQIFEQAGAILKGHFLLASGLHSPVYWEKFKVLGHPSYIERLCQPLAQHFQDQGIEVVAGPTLGGVILAYEVARQLGVRAIFAEKEGEGRGFRRGLSIEPGERVLIVDDILTTGGSIKEVIAAVTKLQAQIAGIGVIVDRSTEKVDLGIPYFACHSAPIIIYPPTSCPQCQQGLPLVRPGSL